MRIVNKKAFHNYYILEHLEAGVVLSGGEVKAVRAGRLDLGESFVRILNDEVYLINANIPKLLTVGNKGYDPFRNRKLLLHKAQIRSLIGKTSAGMILVPVSLYDKNNNFKVEIGIGKSKKQFDKRRVIKERDHARRLEQELRGSKE